VEYNIKKFFELMVQDLSLYLQEGLKKGNSTGDFYERTVCFQFIIPSRYDLPAGGPRK